ncbi:MAG TPA: hypothetical protein VE028_09735 [Nitratidesulfovibrio sp.]|nr:hypothetical protein [Nitratidesulfovibrio sp.]
MRQIDRIDRVVERQPHVPSQPKGYDPELMFVECARCGRPVMWEHGRATVVLHGVGVKAADIDEHCMIVTDGCAHCHPEEDEYRLKVIRISEIVYRDLLRDGEALGNA